MNLDVYLNQIEAGGTGAPDSLQLQDTFATQLFGLYQVAEARGLERGGPLLYDRGTSSFALGEVMEGLPFSMNIPVTDHPGNFGDVHAHPSASIGHAGGHSAHSMDDLWNFRKTVNKPFWIQFVVSGPWLYALVQVDGVSKWDNTVQNFLADRGGAEVGRMTEAIEKLVGGREKWKAMKEKVALTEDKVKYEALLAEYKNKAKVGPLMQELSVRHCAEFARAYNFFFYTGQGNTLTRMLSV